MKPGFLILTLGLVSASQALAADAPKSIAGTWEGESRCMVPTSPCRDEHVIYEITDKPGGRCSVAGSRVVSGEKKFMGTLECSYTPGKLHCPSEGRNPGSWDFVVAGSTMDGTLILEEGHTLYRKIHLERK